MSQFYVAIELARVGRISIAIQDFYVATKLATIESFAAHDRVGHVKASVHDRVWCHVVSRHRRPCAHDRLGLGTRTTRSGHVKNKDM